MTALPGEEAEAKPEHPAELVERVAKAIYESDGDDLLPWSELLEGKPGEGVGRELYRHLARAAIEAIRPSPAQRLSRDYNPEPPVGAPDDRVTVNVRGRPWFVSLFDGARGQRWYLDGAEEIAELAQALRPSPAPAWHERPTSKGWWLRRTKGGASTWHYAMPGEAPEHLPFMKMPGARGDRWYGPILSEEKR